ncbi:unnamed protein product, partial [marine sediment metagenome]
RTPRGNEREVQSELRRSLGKVVVGSDARQPAANEGGENKEEQGDG